VAFLINVNQPSQQSTDAQPVYSGAKLPANSPTRPAKAARPESSPYSSGKPKEEVKPGFLTILNGQDADLSQGSWLNPKDGLEYVRIAPGTFMMGCSPGDSQCSVDENPAHRVTLTKGFRMGVTAVTQEAYQRVMRTNPSNFKGAKLPVEMVDWTEAQNYCSKVGMRLPTGAEWEYAARAGTTGARYGELDSIAWYDQNSGRKTHEVGQKAPNAWGLYDMLGNVWQWTGDWWHADKYQGGNETDPKGPASGQYRTLRGGSWYFDALRVRVSFRDWYAPTFRFSSVGFRCVGE
ncbi:MAG: formylglycine-generating enzyme family protein, partial [Acidobacteriia bacterium]|nr:formylglycine-generating enzyme family protein [Terriglobia bacterium]